MAEVGQFEGQAQPLLGLYALSLFDFLVGEPPAQSAGPSAEIEGLKCRMAIHEGDYTQNPWTVKSKGVRKDAGNLFSLD